MFNNPTCACIMQHMCNMFPEEEYKDDKTYLGENLVEKRNNTGNVFNVYPRQSSAMSSYGQPCGNSEVGLTKLSGLGWTKSKNIFRRCGSYLNSLVQKRKMALRWSR